MSPDTTAEDRLARIESLLDMERDALRAGQFDALDGLIGEREAHVAALQGSIRAQDRSAVAQLRLIQTKAQRNARLLGAAKDGFAAGARRIAEITDVQEKLSTYSENGQVSDIMTSNSRVQKRA